MVRKNAFELDLRFIFGCFIYFETDRMSFQQKVDRRETKNASSYF